MDSTAYVGQVILAFILSAYLTRSIVAVGYCCGWIDEELLGELDRRLFKIKSRPSVVWSPLLKKIVLILRSVFILC